MRQIRRLKTFSFNRWINTAYKTISEFLLFWPLLKYLQERGLKKKKNSLSKSTNKPVLNTKPQNLGFRKSLSLSQYKLQLLPETLLVRYIGPLSKVYTKKLISLLLDASHAESNLALLFQLYLTIYTFQACNQLILHNEPCFCN